MISSSAANRETNQQSRQAQRAGPRHQRAQIRKGETTGADGVVVGHGGSVLKLGDAVWTPFADFNPCAERYLLNSFLCISHKGWVPILLPTATL